MTDFKEKYLKYKTKYLDLKTEILYGRGKDDEDEDPEEITAEKSDINDEEGKIRFFLRIKNRSTLHKSILDFLEKPLS